MSLRSIKLGNIDAAIIYFESQIKNLEGLKMDGIVDIDGGIARYNEFIKELKEERQDVIDNPNV